MINQGIDVHCVSWWDRLEVFHVHIGSLSMWYFSHCGRRRQNPWQWCWLRLLLKARSLISLLFFLSHPCLFFQPCFVTCLTGGVMYPPVCSATFANLLTCVAVRRRPFLEDPVFGWTAGWDDDRCSTSFGSFSFCYWCVSWSCFCRVDWYSWFYRRRYVEWSGQAKSLQVLGWPLTRHDSSGCLEFPDLSHLLF